MANRFQIDKAKSRADFDNGCLQPSDGGTYDAKTAISILENGCGGTMRNVKTGAQLQVNYKASENDWLRKKLKIK